VVCYMVFDTCIAGVAAAASSKTAPKISGTGYWLRQEGLGTTQPLADTQPASSSSPSSEVLGGRGMVHGV
jgi:hypothetical protein